MRSDSRLIGASTRLVMLIVVAAVMVEVFAPSSARSQMPKNVLAYTQYRYTSHTETSSAAEFALSAWSEKFRECGVCEFVVHFHSLQ